MFGRHVSGQLSAYHDGELPIAESQRVAGHLAACPGCRREFDELKFGAMLAGKLPLAAAPASLWGDIEKGLAAEAPTTGRLRTPWGWRLTMAAAALILGMAALWFYARQSSRGWEVVRLEGAPVVGSERIGATARITAGEWLETDGASRAKINVGIIGQVEIEPNTRIRLLRAQSTEHRLSLARGAMRAKIWAPPRLFFLETPAALAVDLGCAYSMQVDGKGWGMLRVTSGWVLLEDRDRESMVPGGALCQTRPGIGPGTPYFADAPEKLQGALVKFDFENGGALALGIVVAEARPRDTLTLWHLLGRVEEAQRSRVYDRMAALVPAPTGVSREKALQLDPATLARWKAELEWVW